MERERASDPPISTIMARGVVCVEPETSVETLTVLFLDHDIGCVPVLDSSGRAIGVVSKTDVLRAGWEPAAWCSSGDDELEPIPRAIAGEIMTPFLFALPPDASISRAAALMAYEGIEHVVVTVDDHRVVGIVSGVDVMRWLGQGAGYVIPWCRPYDRKPMTRRDEMLKRIMIVDDDPAILDDYAELLREEGYMVTTAANGAEALQRLRASEPLSLIMLDLRMPVMDGHSFNAMLRKDPTFDHVPVVLLSGAVEILAEVDRMGASGFLAKPATVTELLGTVQTFCGPS